MSENIPGRKFYSDDKYDKGDNGARLADINGDGLPDKIDSYLRNNGDREEWVFINYQDHWEFEGQLPDWDARQGYIPPEIPGQPFTKETERDYGTDTKRDIHITNGARLVDINADGYADKVDSHRSIVGGWRANNVYLNLGPEGFKDEDGTRKIWEDESSDTLPGLPFITYNTRSIATYELGTITWDEVWDMGSRMKDLNGDGRIDKVDYFKDTVSGNTVENVYLNTENGWKPVSWNIPGLPLSKKIKDKIKLDQSFPTYDTIKTVDTGSRLLDVNGDGLPDKVDYVRKEYATLSIYKGCYKSSNGIIVPMDCDTCYDCQEGCLRETGIKEIENVYLNTSQGWTAEPVDKDIEGMPFLKKNLQD